MAAVGQDAYVSLLISDSYLPGAMVLAHSLRDHGTKKQLAILITPDSLQDSTIEELKKLYDHIIPVDRIVSKSIANLYLMDRPDLGSTFTKIRLWRQTQFRHIVYIDADVVALRAPDELFHSPPSFAGVPDLGWPDCFNSGVLSLKPNMGDYYSLLALAERGISFDDADQGLLNMHFRDWQRLSFTYNCTIGGNYYYVPAYRHFSSSISMIHYIGSQKPWKIGREIKGGGAPAVIYEEVLGRWWQVYDKHYRSPTTAHISGQVPTQLRTVQQYVRGEISSTESKFSSVEPNPDGLNRLETSVHTAEPSLNDKSKLVEGNQRGEVKPAPTVEQRRYSVDWDPMHQPPPLNSRPEAANFPHEIYNMSADPKLFQAPKNPEPPKGMYYEIPSTPPAPESLPPLFPWENDQPKPARVFADEKPSAPPQTSPSATTNDDNTHADAIPPSTPTIQLTSPEAFASYQRTNAWDDVPAIDRYISNLAQNRHARIQVLHHKPTSSTTNPSTATEGILSPSVEDPHNQSQQQRRPSMKLTDFPSEIERPSLPVTPAPVRRPSFWGAERDAQCDLPGAEGVPDQSEWDPTAKLAELQRRQSEVLAQGPTSPGRAIPDRELPGSASMPMSEVKENIEGEAQAAPVPAAPAQAAPTTAAAPLIFNTVDLGGRALDFSGGSADEKRGSNEEAEVGPTKS